jgi:hypothetical protein
MVPLLYKCDVRVPEGQSDKSPPETVLTLETPNDAARSSALASLD